MGRRLQIVRHTHMMNGVADYSHLASKQAHMVPLIDKHNAMKKCNQRTLHQTIDEGLNNNRLCSVKKISASSKFMFPWGTESSSRVDYATRKNSLNQYFFCTIFMVISEYVIFQSNRCSPRIPRVIHRLVVEVIQSHLLANVVESSSGHLPRAVKTNATMSSNCLRLYQKIRTMVIMLRLL